MITSDDEPGFEARFASLEEASRNLSTDVIALNATLLVVAELQTEQREQGRRQEKAEQQIRMTRQLAEQREARTRSVLRLGGIVAGVLLPVVSILVYVSLIGHVNELLAQQRSAQYTNCGIRNQVPLLNAQREFLLAGLEKDPRLKAVHQESARQLTNSVVDCRKYLPKAK